MNKNPYPGQRVIPVRDLYGRKRNPFITILIILGLIIGLSLLLFYG